MSDDPLDFFDETPTDEAAATPEPEQAKVAPQAEPQEEPQAEPEGTGETAEPPSAPEEKSKEVPFVALMDEREKRQAAQREAEELRKRIAEYERQNQGEQSKPDFYEDPEAAIQRQVHAAIMHQSRFSAEKEYGKEAVQEAYEYFVANPREGLELNGHPSPFHAAVELRQRQKKIAEMGDDPDAWVNAQVEARLAERLSQSPAPKAPPPSMSKAPSTGGEKLSPGSAFDDVFGG